MPEAHCNRAVALQDLGRLEDALAAADRALRYRPQYATAHYNRGNVLKALTRSQEAADAYSKALVQRPDFAEALLNRGLAQIALRQWLQALADFNKALTLRPGYAAAHVGRAEAYRGLNDLPSAFGAIDAAVGLDPDNADAALIKAEVLLAANRDDEALAVADAILAGDPASSRAHTARAQALRELQRYDEALAAAEEAVRLAPASADVQVAHAMTLAGVGRFEDSLAALAAAERLGASAASYLEARGVVTGSLGDPAGAMPWFDRAVALQPDNAGLRYNRAFAYLTLGRFEEGWPEHEWRLKKRKHGHAQMRELAPQWRGEDLEGKKLVIYAEQGHGDSIQFTRYLPLAAERGGAITLTVQEALRRLYEENFPEIDVAAGLGMRTGFDYQISLMSLPMVFGTTREAIPQNVPYLKADAARAAKWRDRLDGDGFKVGIVWQGNPKYRADRQRSFKPTEFAPLARLPGVRLISLQWTGGADQPTDLGDGLSMETLGEEIVNNPDGFREVAAVMANLDLLVMSDTGPAHLAGALGRPVWVALTTWPDWRWMREGTTTPWYPTMRLFRQRKFGDWPGAFAEIAGEVRKLIDGRA
jgi:tetratricopeptide (TPR) repeat protein